MKGIFLLGFLLLFSTQVLADKPVIEYGERADLKDVRKIFIDTGRDLDLRDEIGGEIRKLLPEMKIAGRAADAEIHLRFIYQVTGSSGGMPPQVLKTPEASVVKVLGANRERMIMTMQWKQSSGLRPRIGFGRKPRPDLEFAREFVKIYKEENEKRAASQTGGQTAVELLRTWNGEIKIELQKAAPADGYIVSQEKWESLWKAFRGTEEIPMVDFKNELVLVAVGKDPNRITIRPAIDGKGDLTVQTITTMMGFLNPTTCRYQFGVISRTGIKTIEGKSIREK